MSNDEKIERLTEILYDQNICNAAKFEQMEEVLLDKDK
jgi:hypothetical protein